MHFKNKINIFNYFKKHNYNARFKLFIGVLIIIVCVLVDNLTKFYVIEHLKKNQPVPFLPGFISFKYVENKGSAFGVNSDNLKLSIALALLTTIIALVFYIILYEKLYIISLSMILGGSFGNLLNRIWNHGAVVDFLSWDLFPPHSVFNIADFFVNIGIIILVIAIFVEEYLKDIIYNLKHK